MSPSFGLCCSAHRPRFDVNCQLLRGYEMRHQDYLLSGIVCAVLLAAMAPAYGADPLSAGQKGLYEGVTNNIIRAAEKMPESNYSFKPSPDVRSFGQLVGHLADAQYGSCSLASGESNPMKAIEKTKTSKTDLVAALKEAVGYCNKAYSGMTDSQGGQMVK